MVNWGRIAVLREEVGADDFLEVADIFLEEVSETLQRLSQGKNVNTLEGELHFLKGAALNLGFDEFAALCRDGEMKAAASDFGSVNISEVIACFNASRTSFVEGLANRLAS